LLKKQVSLSSKDVPLALDLEKVEQDIQLWIEHFLSLNHPVFNNLPPCPFAKKAWTDGAVQVILCPDPRKFGKEIDLLEEQKEVLIYIFNRAFITPNMLATIAENFNKNHPELLALEDHPEDVEKVQNVIMNHGCYAMILVQNRDKVNRARKILAKQGYYDNWSDEYLESVTGS